MDHIGSLNQKLHRLLQLFALQETYHLDEHYFTQAMLLFYVSN